MEDKGLQNPIDIWAFLFYCNIEHCSNHRSKRARYKRKEGAHSRLLPPLFEMPQSGIMAVQVQENSKKKGFYIQILPLFLFVAVWQASLPYAMGVKYEKNN